MINNERHSLPAVIGGDLLRHGKLPIILLISVLVTSIMVVITTQKTRLLTAQREQMVLEKDSLDIEWRNLILEENALGDHSRVERLAVEKLHMQH
ncbi:cell division protein FtsL, partial [Rosenbergiella collisarenosi]